MTSLPSVFSSSAHFGPSGIPPPVLRYDVEELQLFVTKSVICSPALLRMLKCKTSALIELFTVKWEEIYILSFYFLQLQTLLLLLFRSVIVVFSSSVSFLLPPSYSSSGTLCHLISPFLLIMIHVAFRLTTSDSVFLFGCFEKSVILYLFYSYMSLFWFIFPCFFFILSFLFHYGVAFKDYPHFLMYISHSN